LPASRSAEEVFGIFGKFQSSKVYSIARDAVNPCKVTNPCGIVHTKSAIFKSFVLLKLHGLKKCVAFVAVDILYFSYKVIIFL
jgi:hypothetical protein